MQLHKFKVYSKLTNYTYKTQTMYLLTFHNWPDLMLAYLSRRCREGARSWKCVVTVSSTWLFLLFISVLIEWIISHIVLQLLTTSCLIFHRATGNSLFSTAFYAHTSIHSGPVLLFCLSLFLSLRLEAIFQVKPFHFSEYLLLPAGRVGDLPQKA